MSVESRYLFVVSMDVEPEHEALFNEVYDTEHIPYLLEVPGVRSVTRLKGEPFKFAIGGEEKAMPAASPVYSALYEIDDLDVLASAAWGEAVERGRWSSHVRPHTSNRSHGAFRVV